MQAVKAAKVNIPGSSPIWELAKETPAFFKDNADVFVIDAEWLREEADGECPNCLALAKALDEEKTFEGWRDVNLLYVWCK